MKPTLKLCAVLAAVLLTLSVSAAAQAKPYANSQARQSAAFAEVLLRKTELLSEAEALAADYTESNPKMIDLRYEVAGLEKYLTKLLSTPSADAPKLTDALGKLIVKRMELDTELNRLSRTLNAEHPDRMRLKKRVDVFDAAIKEILQ